MSRVLTLMLPNTAHGSKCKVSGYKRLTIVKFHAIKVLRFEKCTKYGKLM